MADEVESLDLFADVMLVQGKESLIGEIEVIELPASLDEPEHVGEPVLQVDPQHDVLARAPVEEPSELLDMLLDTNGQIAFIDFDEWWKVEWQGMPEFIQDEKRPWKSMYVHFRSREDLLEFGKMVKQRLTNDTPSVWYPEMPREKRVHLAYVDEV